MQVIPHITNELKERMRAQAAGSPGVSDADAPDVIITEIGGTVGDIESLPFLEAARQVRHDLGRDSVFFLHVSLVPYLAPSGELKTKPTQHSVAALRQVGIQPDALVLRADREIPESIKRKISLMCDVDTEAVAAAVDAPSIYDIPKVLHREGLDAYVIRRLGLTFRDVDWTDWDLLLDRVHEPEHEVEVALVGKYIDLPDAYLSVTEALRAGGFHHDAKVRIRWVASDSCETEAGATKALGGADAVLIPGGFGVRGIEGKVGALRWAREQRRPDAGHLPGAAVHGHRVRAHRRRHRGGQLDRVRPRHARSGHRDDGGAEGLRRGRGRPRRDDAAGPLAGRRSSRARSSPGPTARPSPTSGTATGTRSTSRTARGSRTRPGHQRDAPRARPRRVRRAPKDVHPYYVSTQAHPEFKSRPTRAHPLFAGLIGAAIEEQRASRLVEVERHRTHEHAEAHA